MFSERVFQVAFLISLISHTIILLGIPRFSLPVPNKNKKNIELVYIKESPISKKEIVSKKDLPLDLSRKITAKKMSPPPFVKKENILKPTLAQISPKENFVKPNLPKTDVIAVKKKITLPALDLDKINNPNYLSYYQVVREKIRRSAYQYYNRTETGQIYLSFIISCDGILRELRLIEEKSSQNPYLREIALKSIQSASPFPNFPKELDYPQLSFNVIISFEIE